MAHNRGQTGDLCIAGLVGGSGVDELMPDGVGNPAFWSAMAAVAPILALTLVIEARYAVKDWNGWRERWTLKLVMTAAFTLASLGCVLVLGTALLRLLKPDVIGLSALAAMCLTAFAAGIVLTGAMLGDFLEPALKRGTAPARARTQRAIVGRPRTRRITAATASARSRRSSS